MVPLKNHRWCLIYLSALMTLAITGCASRGGVGHDPYVSKGAQDYPVTIVAARLAPAGDVDVTVSRHNLWLGRYIPVTVETKTWGKADGARQYAGMGALECGIRSLEAGPYFPFIFVPCAVLAVPVMAAVGAWETAPKTEVDAVRRSLAKNLETSAHGGLVEKARAHLAGVSERTISVEQGLQTSAGEAVARRSDYPPQPNAGGTLLELGLLEIRLAGSGKMEAPLCLHMAARARKFDVATGEPIQELEHARIIECHQASEWLAEDGVLFGRALDNGQQMLAERLVDQLYLIYKPKENPLGLDQTDRRVPPFVLAPISPPAPDVYLDLRSLTKKARHIQGWGGMHFVDTGSLTPILIWEAFPRPFDMPGGGFSAVTYDLRLYTGEVLRLGVVEPTRLLREWSGLVEPRHVLSTPLQPCTHYFWTVRARFTLDGVRRVTEWAGAYDTAGGKVTPSYEFYYPFRTPAAVDGADCWS